MRHIRHVERAKCGFIVECSAHFWDAAPHPYASTIKIVKSLIDRFGAENRKVSHVQECHLRTNVYHHIG